MNTDLVCLFECVKCHRLNGQRIKIINRYEDLAEKIQSELDQIKITCVYCKSVKLKHTQTLEFEEGTEILNKQFRDYIETKYIQDDVL